MGFLRMALTDLKIRNAKPRKRRYRLADANNLSIEITPKGGRYWRYRYRLNGKENLYAGGEWCRSPVGETAEKAEERRQRGVADSPDRALGREVPVPAREPVGVRASCACSRATPRHAHTMPFLRA